MNKHETIAFKHIYPKIKEDDLKEIYKEHIIDNEWNVVTKLRNIQKKKEFKRL